MLQAANVTKGVKNSDESKRERLPCVRFHPRIKNFCRFYTPRV